MIGHFTLILVSFNLILDLSLALKDLTILQVVSEVSEVSGVFSRCGSLLSYH